MNKKELAKVYSKISREKLSIKKGLKEIEIFLETVEDALEKEGEVVFINKGIFEILKRKARNISNPTTREKMTIYPKKIVKFRVSKNLWKEKRD